MIPSKPGKRSPKTRIIEASLPSSASMLADLRTALTLQVSKYREEASKRQFDHKEIAALAQLVSTVQVLDANTARIATDVATMVEDMTPEQLAEAEAEAMRLLAASGATSVIGRDGGGF